MELKVIAHMVTDFDTKFGLPRQSGIVPSLGGTVVFEKEYAVADALRGLEAYSHLWIIWGFSEGFVSRDKDGDHGACQTWSPTVRPPRLGGNKRMGVFATRSPNRPNPIGLSCVKIEEIILKDNASPAIRVSGVDMLCGTPIYDIKPYLPHADSYPDALGGFAAEVNGELLKLDDNNPLLNKIPEDKREALVAILREDPRPSYQNDPDRVYGFPYAGYEISFSVLDNSVILRDIEKL